MLFHHGNDLLLANLVTKPIPQFVLLLALAAPCSSQTAPASHPSEPKAGSLGTPASHPSEPKAGSLGTPASLPPPAPADPAVAGVNLPEAPCDQAAPLPGIEDYSGPFNKVAAAITRKLEIRTVHRPHHKPGARLCSLDAREKFHLFVEDNFEPVSFIAAGFDAGIAQAGDDDPTFGQGAEGYGKRYGVALTDNISDGFFRTFLFPAVLHEDPRYYRQLHGSVPRRLAHALRHVFVARTDSGQLMFNFSEWLGTSSARALSNLYHPGNHRGFQPAARGVAFSIGTDMGVDVLREFWPELARALHLPLTGRPHPEP